MYWGVFAISAAHPLLYKITLKSPNPHETSESLNFNVIDIKKTINLKTVYILISDVFFT